MGQSGLWVILCQLLLKTIVLYMCWLLFIAQYVPLHSLQTCSVRGGPSLTVRMSEYFKTSPFLAITLPQQQVSAIFLSCLERNRPANSPPTPQFPSSTQWDWLTPAPATKNPTKPSSVGMYTIRSPRGHKQGCPGL